MKKTILQFLVFTCVQVISFQLLFDPWGRERFERMFRENARLFNPLLQLTTRLDFIREAIGCVGIVTSLLGLFGLRFFNSLTQLFLFVYWVVYFNFQLLLSERFCYAVVPASLATFGLINII